MVLTIIFIKVFRPKILYMVPHDKKNCGSSNNLKLISYQVKVMNVLADFVKDITA